MGVLDFLKSALSPIFHAKEKIDLLAQASENLQDNSKVDLAAGEQAMIEIERLCEEWRPDGVVKPEYISFRLGKNSQGESNLSCVEWTCLSSI